MDTLALRFCLFTACALFCVACGSDLPEPVAAEMERLPEVVDYNFHVKPILSDRCFLCHGPDAQKREADLRLDTEAGAFAALVSGNGRAIVPDKVHQSQLVHRMLSDDPEAVMPPPESNLTMTPQEKAILIRWIEQGATYKPHWAFQKPVKPDVPEAGAGWAANEIDQFIAARLERENLQPAEEAAREQLIRRLFFDLTGLPPSLADLDRLMADQRPDYYERLVDSLLALPAYGERMAAHWLDVARFADSEGYLDDFHHTFWPYRDWVIEAFNKNLSYDEFILWQVGGDQMPNATQEQKLATAFNRNHKQNSEGGIIPEEFRVEYVVDRTNTLGAAFLGLTLGCARCHDHKYDPISQEEYFQLFSYFNSTVERGDGIFGYNAIENGQMVPDLLSMNAGPVMALPDSNVAAVREYLLQQIEEKEVDLQQFMNSNTADFAQWINTQPKTEIMERMVRTATVNHLTFDDMDNGKSSDLAPGNGPASYWGKVKPAPGKFGQAIQSDAAGQLVAEGKKSAFERNEPFTVSFWINTPKEFDEGHVMYNGNNRIQGYRGWDVVLDSAGLSFRLSHAHPYQSLHIRTKEPLPLNEWVHFVWTYDGSSQTEGMRLWRDGKEIAFDTLRNYIYRSSRPYMDNRATVYMPYKGLIIGNRHYDQDFTGGLLDEIIVLNREVGPLAARYLYDNEEGKNAFGDAIAKSSDAAHQFYNLFVDEELAARKAALSDIRLKEIVTIDTVQEIMIMGDWEQERPTYILDRGVYDAHGKPVSREVPNSLLAWPDDLPRNRYGLGQWLVHPDHPLTSRVAVNQIWYLLFGRGLVETVEDFGNQGSLPSHPELLDWLAVDFRENGWNLKRLVRQMVTSSTYRQSSRIRPELNDIDPDNLLLARGQRYRRSAEMVRDNILAAGGLLEKKIGGPSTFPYQPPELWGETIVHPFFPEYEEDEEEGLYRRSIYTFWKRNVPPPSMLIFDASLRSECQVRRQRSNTPLQALVLLNDPQMVEGCRSLAERVWRGSGGRVDVALQNAFRLLTSRAPAAREQSILLAQYEEELAYFRSDDSRWQEYLSVGYRERASDVPGPELAALSRVSNTIMNTTEAYYKN